MEKTDILHRTVGDMVAEDYRTAEIFKRYGIDFCCGGKRTVADVCAAKGIDGEDLAEKLAHAAPDQNASPEPAFAEWSLPFLADYIVEVHHHYVRDRLPRLLEYARKVAKVHGHAWPENIAIADQVTAIFHEMTEHMAKEEKVLFPYIRHLWQTRELDRELAEAPFGSIENPIHVMEEEHENVGEAMRTIRLLSHDYTPPLGACNTYIVLYKLLEEFESDLHRHVHLENNILFPRAVRLEASLSA